MSKLTSNECQAARYLQAAGYTYENLEQILGVTSATLSEHCNGRCDCPDLAEPIKLPDLDGDEIRAARKARDMTIDELADTVGVSRSTVSAWENYDADPRPSNLLNLIKTLDLNHLS